MAFNYLIEGFGLASGHSRIHPQRTASEVEIIKESCALIRRVFSFFVLLCRPPQLKPFPPVLDQEDPKILATIVPLQQDHAISISQL
jgi:hypothetical protein